MNYSNRMVVHTRDYDELFKLLLRTDGEVREWLLILTRKVPQARRAIQECYARALSEHMLAQSLGLRESVDVSTLWHDDVAMHQAEELYEFTLRVYDYLKEHPHSSIKDVAHGLGTTRLQLTHLALMSLQRLGLVRYSGPRQGAKYSTSDTLLSSTEQRIQRAEAWRERYKAKVVSALLSEETMEAAELHRRVGHTWYYFRNAVYELIRAGVLSAKGLFVNRSDSVSVADEAKAREYVARITDGEPK